MAMSNSASIDQHMAKLMKDLKESVIRSYRNAVLPVHLLQSVKNTDREPLLKKGTKPDTFQKDLLFSNG